MTPSRIGALVVLLLACAGSNASAAPDDLSGRAHLDRARTALAELDYTKARGELSAALRTGDLDRERLVAVYRLAGQVAAAFGDADGATDSYQRMLVLEPGAKLPAGLAPKLVAPFDRARTRMKGSDGLGVTVRVDDRDKVVIKVTADPLKMAAGVVVAFRQPGTERRLRAAIKSGRATVMVPVDVARFFRVRVVDRAGNELARRESRLPPAVVTPDPPRGAEPAAASDAASASASDPDAITSEPPARRGRRASTPLLARWYVWGVAAVGAGAASVYFGRRALDDWDRLDLVISNSSSYSFQEARDLEASGRRNQLISNIGVGAAVGLGGIATYLLVRGTARGEKRRVVPVVSRGGAAVVVQGAFR